MEVGGNYRSVMPLAGLGRTRVTLIQTTSRNTLVCCPDSEECYFGKSLGKLDRNGDCPLQLLDMNEEFLVSAIHDIVLTLSLLCVHTARRYFRWNDLVRPSDVENG